MFDRLYICRYIHSVYAYYIFVYNANCFGIGIFRIVFIRSNRSHVSISVASRRVPFFLSDFCFVSLFLFYSLISFFFVVLLVLIKTCESRRRVVWCSVFDDPRLTICNQAIGSTFCLRFPVRHRSFNVLRNCSLKAFSRLYYPIQVNRRFYNLNIYVIYTSANLFFDE